MAASVEDLDLLLSLQDDRVLETPPASPSPHIQSSLPAYNSDDDGSPSRRRPRASADMSVFRDAVKDYLDAATEPTPSKPLPRRNPNKQKPTGEVTVEKFSGLRLKNQLVSPIELTNRLSDIRFVRLPAIRNLISGDKFSGSWATIGVLTEKGEAKLSSARKSYCIWKLGCLDESTVSVFLFGDAYTQNCKESVGTAFALFNSGVRRDAGGKGFSGFSLSVYSAAQVLKLGTASDYGICKGKRKDGLACTMVINKRQGIYCKYHTSNSSQKYSTMRAELKGGNIQMMRTQSEGIYMVDPLADRVNTRKPSQRVKVLSVDGLKKALSNSDKVTTNCHSQGIRFLSQVTANMESDIQSKGSVKPNHIKGISAKRPTSVPNMVPKSVIKKEQPDAKRRKTSFPENMIELDILSSDEECQSFPHFEFR